MAGGTRHERRYYSKPPDFRPWVRKQCADKLEYKTERVAVKAAEQAALEFGCPMFTYRCPQCKRYHLTSRRPY